MKKRSSTPSPIVTLKWNEYKKGNVIERFPLSVLCGMVVLTLSLSSLYDRSMEKRATDEPVSIGLSVIEDMLC